MIPINRNLAPRSDWRGCRLPSIQEPRRFNIGQGLVFCGLAVGTLILGLGVGCLAACCSGARLAMLPLGLLWAAWALYRFLH